VAVTFGATLHDGTYTKVFSVTSMDGDAPCELAVVFDGLGGRPSPFGFGMLTPNSVPLQVSPVRYGAAGGASEFGYHSASSTGVTICKLTQFVGGKSPITVHVTVRAIHPADR
jgi:hypothetical protein